MRKIKRTERKLVITIIENETYEDDSTISGRKNKSSKWWKKFFKNVLIVVITIIENYPILKIIIPSALAVAFWKSG